METKITFSSDGLKLSGIVHTPDDLRSGERRPAFIVLHGFGGNKDGHGQSVVAKQFTQWGYVTIRIDFRGCGESEGEHGRIICLDQVADTRNALSYLATRPEVDPERIGLVGSSFGAAVAVFTGGADRRVAAVISCGGWGDGERKFRGQHPTPEAWSRFANMLEEGEASSRANRQVIDGAALRHRAHPRAPASQHERRVDHGVSCRNGAEHERFPRRRPGRQYLTAAAAASA